MYPLSPNKFLLKHFKTFQFISNNNTCLAFPSKFSLLFNPTKASQQFLPLSWQPSLPVLFHTYTCLHTNSKTVDNVFKRAKKYYLLGSITQDRCLLNIRIQMCFFIQCMFSRCITPCTMAHTSKLQNEVIQQ